MAIPDFDHNNVIPPFLRVPTNSSGMSPHECTIIEFCKHFATTPLRIELLKNLVRFRLSLQQHGLVNAVQWIGGSFVEKIEELGDATRPKDIDLVTLYYGYDDPFIANLVSNFPDFSNPHMAKQNFNLDHYPINFNLINTANGQVNMEFITKRISYFLQLFSHTRSGVWKGMINIHLNTHNDDLDAKQFLAKVTI